MSTKQDKEIETLMKLFEASDWRELSLRTEDLQLFLSKDAEAGGLQSAAAQKPAENAVQPAADSQDQDRTTASAREGLTAIRAANVGTFFRTPKPGEAPYVEVGDPVTPDTEVCLIEVMKLFTPQQAGVTGIIREVCIEDAQMVEYDQPLFYVEPANE